MHIDILITYIYVYMCMYTCMNTDMCLHLYTCMYAYIYIYVYTYVYTYIVICGVLESLLWKFPQLPCFGRSRPALPNLNLAKLEDLRLLSP